MYKESVKYIRCLGDQIRELKDSRTCGDCANFTNNQEEGGCVGGGDGTGRVCADFVPVVHKPFAKQSDGTMVAQLEGKNQKDLVAWAKDFTDRGFEVKLVSDYGTLSKVSDKMSGGTKQWRTVLEVSPKKECDATDA